MLSTLTSHLPQLRRELRRRRRILALLVVCAAFASVVPAVVPAELRGIEVLIAGRDIPAGTEITAAHFARARVPREAVPVGGPPSEAALLGRSAERAIPAGAMLGPWLLADEQSVRAPAGTEIMAVPVPVELAGRMEPGARIALMTPDLASGSVRRITATVIEPPRAEATAAIPLPEASGAGSPVALLAVETTGARDVAHATAEAWVGVSVVD